MRVISGKYKGKNITGFNIDGTRPTMDRLKESLFGMIQNKIKDSVCLDLFAGSGSLGLEAISNGADSCYFIDNNKIVIDTLKKNMQDLSEKIFILKKDYKDALDYFKSENIKFDIIFLDPPYSFNYIGESIWKILENDLLNDGAIIVCEYETEDFTFDQLEIIKEKRYGTKWVRIYQK